VLNRGVVRWPSDESAPVVAHARSVHLVARSPGWLRQCASGPLAWVTTRHATVSVVAWAPPRPGWSGRLGALPGLLRHEVRLPTTGHGRTSVEVSLAEAQPLHLVIGAVLEVLAPKPSLPAPMSPDVAAYGPIPGWLPAQANTAAFVGPEPDAASVRPFDVLLTAPATDGTGPATDGPGIPDGVATVLAEPSGIRSPEGRTILVDVAGANPRGYRSPTAESRDGVLTVVDDRWVIEADGEPVGEGSLTAAQLDDRQLAALRTLRGLTCTGLGEQSGAVEAALLARFAMTGVVLLADPLPATAAELLAPEVAKILTEEPPGAEASPLDWEIRSVRQRREALRQHATGLALPSAVGVLPVGHRLPSVSALLVTMRPDELGPAIAALEAQTYPDLEVVLGLHGCGRTPEVDRALAGLTRPVEVVEIPAARNFGEALGEVTARSRGTLITKIDDDDQYGPEHIWDLVLGRHYSGATIVGKTSEFVYLEQLGVTVRRTAMNSEAFAPTVAGGTMLLSRGDLESVGGWRPLARSVDRGLLDRVSRDGGLTYRTHSLGFIYTRHGRGHTWDPGLDHFLHASGQQWSGLPRYPEFGTVEG
jgi:hypothetical protein